jgi:hypothetical protein
MKAKVEKFSMFTWYITLQVDTYCKLALVNPSGQAMTFNSKLEADDVCDEINTRLFAKK